MALKLTVKPKVAESKPTLTVAVNEATQYRELRLKADEIEAELKLLKAQLLLHADAHRDHLLRSGQSASSVRIPTSDGNRVLVVYQERYRGIDMENVEALQEAFGDQYALLCEEKHHIAVSKGTTMEKIEEVVGKTAFKKLQSLLTVTSSVAPRKGAAEQIARLFAEGEQEMADDLTTFVTTCNTAPSVRAK